MNMTFILQGRACFPVMPGKHPQAAKQLINKYLVKYKLAENRDKKIA
ncbi:hypothetical protein [Chitinimonas naiadis]